VVQAVVETADIREGRLRQSLGADRGQGGLELRDPGVAQRRIGLEDLAQREEACLVATDELCLELGEPFHDAAPCHDIDLVQ
jgi:hypothetical protein